MRSIIALLLLGITCQAADPSLPTLIISDSGYSWMIQDENGKPILYEFAQVIVLGKKQPPVVTPPVVTPPVVTPPVVTPPVVTPPVKPPIESEFGLQAQIPTWLITVGEAGKWDIPIFAKALKGVADDIDTGDFKTIGEVEAELSIVIKSVNKHPAEWKAFGTALYATFEALKGVGKIKTPKDFARALNEVVKGMK